MIEARHRILGTVAYMGGVMSVPEPFVWSLANMLAFTVEAVCAPGEHIAIDKSKFSLHDVARNDIARRFEGDWLLMLDTDIAFEPDLAARLLAVMNRYNLDVVTAVYPYKSMPHYPVLYIRNEETEQNEIVAVWDRSSEVIQVDSAGAGALFVRRNVFERIVAELGENPFDRIGNKGEDHSFFERLRLVGIKAYCAWKIEVQHIEHLGLSVSTHFSPEREPDHVFVRETFGSETAAPA